MQEQCETNERRQHPRVEAAFAANYRVLNNSQLGAIKENEAYKAPEALTLDLSEHPAQRTVTANISEAGFCLLAECNLPEGSVLLLDMLMPGLPLPVRLLSQVKRVEVPGAGQRFHRLGVRILAINSHGLQRLRDLVKERSLLNGIAA